MTEAELLGVAQSSFDQVGQLFAQVITINFAMAAAVFYFLNEARRAMKVFAFVIYAAGMAMYAGFLRVETQIWDSVTTALRALPPAILSAPSRQIIALSDSLVMLATSLFLHFGFIVLIAGSAFLVFFWKKEAHVARLTARTEPPSSN